MAQSFSGIIDAWVRESEARITAVRRRSVELLAEEMSNTKPNGGKIPIDTGNLARSVRASTSAMPTTAPGPFTSQDIGIVTARLENDQPVWLGYQARYARRVNYGFVGADSLGRVYNQQGQHFVEAIIADWPNIVKKAIAELKG